MVFDVNDYDKSVKFNLIGFFSVNIQDKVKPKRINL